MTCRSPEGAAIADQTDEFDEDGNAIYGRCPRCGRPYTQVRKPCRHLITDWCFTADTPGGYWATDEEGGVLQEFIAAVDAFAAAVEVSNIPRKLLQAHLPRHLRTIQKDIPRGAGLLSLYLPKLIVRSAGYIGRLDGVETYSMCGDSWDIHWAENGKAAAAEVEAVLRADVKTITKAIAKMQEGLAEPRPTAGKKGKQAGPREPKSGPK